MPRPARRVRGARRRAVALLVGFATSMVLGAGPAASQLATRPVLVYGVGPGEAGTDGTAGVLADGFFVEVRASGTDGLEVSLPLELAGASDLTVAAATLDAGGKVARSTSFRPRGTRLVVDLPVTGTAPVGELDAWVEVSALGATFRTPPVPLRDLQKPGLSGAGTAAWSFDEAGDPLEPVGGDSRPVAMAAPPSLTVDDTSITVQFYESPVRNIDGSDVIELVDTVTFRAPGEWGAVLGEIHVDELSGQVEAATGAAGAGPVVRSSPPGLGSEKAGSTGSTQPSTARVAPARTPLAALGIIGPGKAAKLDRAVLASTFGTPLASDTFVGLERQVRTADRRLLRFGGVSASLQARVFANGPVDEEEPAGPGLVGPAVTLIAIVLAGVVLASVYRRSMFAEVRRRRREDEISGLP